MSDYNHGGTIFPRRKQKNVYVQKRIRQIRRLENYFLLNVLTIHMKKELADTTGS